MSIMPFDFVKTQLQKDGGANEKTFYVIKKYYHCHGVGVLYKGWQFKAFQYIVQSVFTVATLEHLENKAKALKH